MKCALFLLCGTMCAMFELALLCLNPFMSGDLEEVSSVLVIPLQITFKFGMNLSFDRIAKNSFI